MENGQLAGIKTVYRISPSLGGGSSIAGRLIVMSRGSQTPLHDMLQLCVHIDWYSFETELRLILVILRPRQS
jgi:hypothetical protein